MKTLQALTLASGMATLLIAVPVYAASRLSMEPSFEPTVTIRTELRGRDTAYVPFQFTAPDADRLVELDRFAAEDRSAQQAPEESDRSMTNLGSKSQ